MKFEGRAVIVTGAGSGIGQAMALAFAREGALVLVVDRRAEAGLDTVARIEATGGKAIFCQTDVSDAVQVRAMIQTCLDRLGGLEILCNNAGIGLAARCHETEDADFDRLMAVNVRGTFLCSKYAIPVFLRQGSGVIINTASVAGLVGLPARAAYCASKAAVIGLTRAMAADYAHAGIRVNAICPSTVDTPWVYRVNAHLGDDEAIRDHVRARIPLGRIGTPEEIAAAALYLASPEAAFVHGSCLIIDGGLTAV